MPRATLLGTNTRGGEGDSSRRETQSLAGEGDRTRGRKAGTLEAPRSQEGSHSGIIAGDLIASLLPLRWFWVQKEKAFCAFHSKGTSQTRVNRSRGLQANRAPGPAAEWGAGHKQLPFLFPHLACTRSSGQASRGPTGSRNPQFSPHRVVWWYWSFSVVLGRQGPTREAGGGLSLVYD